MALSSVVTRSSKRRRRCSAPLAGSSHSPGTLIVLSNPPVTFAIGRGSNTVGLGGRSWQAEVDDGEHPSLRLSVTSCSDDSQEALAQLLAARSHEALQREMEAKALGAEIERMMEHSREVCATVLCGQ